MKVINSYWRLLFGVLFTQVIFAQGPKDQSFVPPTQGPLLLSGTFGELRSNHFHSGIDIKGFVGKPIFSIGDGYISRIKVEAGGYGNVLYINHPNGYTSVYAHLHEFTPEVEAYVKKIQYRQKRFSVDLYLKENQFTFEKGEFIGKMGVSGYSFGPHLHFEIREAVSQKPINPLLYGIKIKDEIRPKLHMLKIYGLDPALKTLNTKEYDLIGAGLNYRIKGDTIVYGAWRVGLGIKAYDHMNGASNWNGVYRIQVEVDGQSTYDFKMDGFSFGERRYLNAHLDYGDVIEKKSYINRCFYLPGNKLTAYNNRHVNPVLQLSEHQTQKVIITVSDADENQSKLTFWVKRGEVKPPLSPVFNYLFPFDEANRIETEAMSISLPKGTLYEDLYFDYRTFQENSTSSFSDIHHLHNDKTPAHRYFELSIMPTSIPKDLMDKAFIAKCEDDGGYTNCGGTWVNGRLKTKIREFGDYKIMIDEVAPTIQPIAFQTNMKGYSKMTFKITDNFDTAGSAKDLSYQATIDGEWVLFEYDLKNDLLIYHFEDRFTNEHEVAITVTDAVGNKRSFKSLFRR